MSPHVSVAPARPQPLTQGTQSTVFGIIAAFTSGLDVLKKFRAQDRGRRRGQPRRDTSDEVQLSKTLRTSPVEINSQYERGYNAFSNRFADGDVVAQAALTGTLLKLNSGLVEIVSTFLANPKKKSHCDFSPLIKLSDESRREAVDALTQLYQRLSTSQPIRPSPRRRSSHEGTSRHSKSNKQSSSLLGKTYDKPRKSASSPKLSSRAPPSNTTVSKIAVRGVKVPQYAFIRQRGAKRSSSGSSASSESSTVSTSSSNSNQSTALTTPSSSPGSSPRIGSWEDSPPPQYVSDPAADQSFQQQPAVPRRRILESQIRQTPYLSAPQAREPEMAIRAPTSSPLSCQGDPSTYGALLSRPSAPFPQGNHPSQQLTRSRTITAATAVPVANRPPPTTLRVQQSMAHFDRNPRASVAYSFTSDSTKLGEIPLHKWSEPFDFDAMERRNKEAALCGRLPPPPVPEPTSRRRGFWSLFKKGSSG